MPNLRSRRIPSPPKTGSTPSPPSEPVSPPDPVRRRSLRLSPTNFTPSPKRTLVDVDFTSSPKRTRNFAVSSANNTLGKNPNFDEISSNPNDNGSCVRLFDVKLEELGQIDVINQRIGGDEFPDLGSGTRIVERLSIAGVHDGVCDNDAEVDGVIDDNNNYNNNDNVMVRVSDNDVELDGVIVNQVSNDGANAVELDGVIDDSKTLGQNEVINRESAGNKIRVVKGLSIGGYNGAEVDGVIDGGKELCQNNENGFVGLRSGGVLIGDSNDGIVSNDVELDGVIGGVINDIKELDKNNGVNEEINENEGLSLRSGTRVVKRLSIGVVDKDVGNLGKKDIKLNDGSGSVGVSDVVQELSRNDGSKEENRENGFLSLRSGSRVENRVSIGGNDEDVGNVVENDGEFNKGSKVEKWVSCGGDDDGIGNVVMNNSEFDLDVKEEEGVVSGGESNMMTRRKYSSDEKGKRRVIVDDQAGMVTMEEDDGLSSFVVEEGVSNPGTILVEGRGMRDISGMSLLGENMLTSPKRYTRDEKGKGRCNVDEGDDAWSSFSAKQGLESPKRYTREEKGKGVATSDDVVIGGNDEEGLQMLNLEPQVDFSVVGLNAGGDADPVINLGGEVNEEVNNLLEDHRLRKHKSRRETHKKIAKLNASKYAYFSTEDENKIEGGGLEQEDGNDTESEAEVPQEETGLNVEDWPGPFSTAMKIIKDREKKMSVQTMNADSNIGNMPFISWTPNNNIGTARTKQSVPSLQTMCLKILAENVDAIHSLNYVPEVLRHKLCQMLCDSRRMNAHFFSLLLQESPAEIRVSDCSWLEEDEFESSIKSCDTSKLTVLQLDLCGHCISDSSLLKAVAPKGLPVLTTISLKGACRISDAGLAALVSAAPVLRSMNLSQCSLLTVVGIKTIADSLGSIVHELYLDDCDTLNAMSILPSLKRLVHLEVLSLRGIGGVSDKFIKKLITSNGHNMKELVLANCVNLTDSSLKIITEKCSQLCVLDLSYLRKLTDVGMVYLANGCRGIQDLRLCRNAFSDNAIAAYLEASGESLKELSLNNLTKVGQNTTLSLARRCINLERLDLSWCRSLTDEAMGLIADSCMSLRLLKIFGCTQITKTFLDGHSNPDLHVIGMKLTPILEHIKRPDFQHGPLYYSAVPSS